MSQELIDWYHRALLVTKGKVAILENREADQGFENVVVRCPDGVEDDEQWDNGTRVTLVDFHMDGFYLVRHVGTGAVMKVSVGTQSSQMKCQNFCGLFQ